MGKTSLSIIFDFHLPTSPQKINPPVTEFKSKQYITWSSGQNLQGKESQMDIKTN